MGGAVVGLTLRSILAAAAAALTKVPLKVLRGKFGRGLRGAFLAMEKRKMFGHGLRRRPAPPSSLPSLLLLLLPHSFFHLPLCSPYLRDNEGHWIRTVFLPRLMGGFFSLLFQPPPL